MTNETIYLVLYRPHEDCDLLPVAAFRSLEEAQKRASEMTERFSGTMHPMCFPTIVEIEEVMSNE